MSDQSSIFFVEIPKTHELAKKLAGEYSDFDVDIPLPFVPSLSVLNTDNGDDSIPTHDSAEKTNDAKLTYEMIVAGLLYVFAYDRENRYFDYYKNLFLSMKKNAKNEIISIAIFQADNFEFGQSIHLLLALEGLFPDDSLVFLNLAQVYEKRMQFYLQSELLEDARQNEKLAESYYSEAIVTDPPLATAFFSAAFFYLSQKNYAKARTLFNTYINLETETNAQAAYRKKKALQIIESINSQQLDDIAYADAIAFIKNDEDEKALSRIRDFLSEHPNVWNGWFVLGWALRKLERYDDAKKAFLTAIEKGKEQDPDALEDAFSDISNELAICCLNLKQYDEAKNWLVSALEFDSENIKLLSNLGFVYYAMGNTEEAEGFFNTVLLLSPNDETAKAMLKKINGTE